MVLLLYDLDLGAVAYSRSIRIVGVNVHLKSEILVYSYLYVVPSCTARTVYVNGDEIVIAKSEARRLVR